METIRKMRPINLKTACEAFKAAIAAGENLENKLRWPAQEGEVEAARTAKKTADEKARQVAEASLGTILSEEQKRARVRKIDAMGIVRKLHEIESKLAISKTAMNGIKAAVDLNAQRFPSSINSCIYVPESTQFEAIYKNGSWRVTDVYRARCMTPQNGIIITHTEESRDAIIARFTHLR